MNFILLELSDGRRALTESHSDLEFQKFCGPVAVSTQQVKWFSTQMDDMLSIWSVYEKYGKMRKPPQLSNAGFVRV